MSRPIKFRAWAKTSKRFVYATIEHNLQPFYQDSLTVLAEGNQFDPPQQFTGLLDKNDTEIYEGDIVSIGSYSYPLEILFERGQWVAKYGAMIDFPHDIKPVAIEVVGNIYESPELLEGAGHGADTPLSDTAPAPKDQGGSR